MLVFLVARLAAGGCVVFFIRVNFECRAARCVLLYLQLFSTVNDQCICMKHANSVRDFHPTQPLLDFFSAAFVHHTAFTKYSKIVNSIKQ